MKAKFAGLAKAYQTFLAESAQKAAAEFAPQQKAVAALMPKIAAANKGEKVDFAPEELAILKNAAVAGEKFEAMSAIFGDKVKAALATQINNAKLMQAAGKYAESDIEEDKTTSDMRELADEIQKILDFLNNDTNWANNDCATMKEKVAIFEQKKRSYIDLWEKSGDEKRFTKDLRTFYLYLMNSADINALQAKWLLNIQIYETAPSPMDCEGLIIHGDTQNIRLLQSKIKETFGNLIEMRINDNGYVTLYHTDGNILNPQDTNRMQEIADIICENRVEALKELCKIVENSQTTGVFVLSEQQRALAFLGQYNGAEMVKPDNIKIPINTIDVQDCIDLETNTGGVLAAGGYILHEILETYYSQSGTYVGYAEAHKAALLMQAKATDIEFIRRFTPKKDISPDRVPSDFMAWTANLINNKEAFWLVRVDGQRKTIIAQIQNNNTPPKGIKILDDWYFPDGKGNFTQKVTDIVNEK